MSSDLAILLTPAGGAAIAVVRLHGAGTGAFLDKHFSKFPRAGRALHGVLADDGRVIDDPVVVVSSDGLTADINLHGGPWVVRSVLELARREGFRVSESVRNAGPAQNSPSAHPVGSALPTDSSAPEVTVRSGDPRGSARGQFAPLPAEAVDADSEIEREVLTHLPLARTELGVRTLLAQVKAWAELRPSPEETSRMLRDRSLWWLLHPPRVAIVGRANVGKSTLANQLFATERSITADMPGTTRDWVGELADVDGLPIILLDTPGLRPTDDPIEAAAIGRASEQIGSADLVVVVTEAGEIERSENASLLTRFPGAIHVLNKCDRSAGGAGDWPNAIHTVATTGEGIVDLRAAIGARFGCSRFELDRPRCWTQRQRDELADFRF